MFQIKVKDREQADQLRAIVSNRLTAIIDTAENPEGLNDTRVAAGKHAASVTELLVLIDHSIALGVDNV